MVSKTWAFLGDDPSLRFNKAQEFNPNAQTRMMIGRAKSEFVMAAKMEIKV
jgi:hypothetical protein